MYFMEIWGASSVSISCIRSIFFNKFVLSLYILPSPGSKQDKYSFCVQQESRAFTPWVRVGSIAHQRSLSRKVQGKISVISEKFKYMVINIISEALQGEWGCSRTDPAMTQVWCNEENGLTQSHCCIHMLRLRGHTVNPNVPARSHSKATPPSVIPAFPALELWWLIMTRDINIVTLAPACHTASRSVSKYTTRSLSLMVTIWKHGAYWRFIVSEQTPSHL